VRDQIKLLKTRLARFTTAHRGGRHRTNEYRISFGSMDEDEAP
jgi:hypothetical protein